MPDALDARLETRALEEFEHHLSACAGCRREWETYAEVRRLLLGVGTEHAPAPLAARVRDAVRRDAVPASAGRSSEHRFDRWSHLRRLGFAKAAAILLAVGLGLSIIVENRVGSEGRDDDRSSKVAESVPGAPRSGRELPDQPVLSARRDASTTPPDAGAGRKPPEESLLVESQDLDPGRAEGRKDLVRPEHKLKREDWSGEAAGAVPSADLRGGLRIENLDPSGEFYRRSVVASLREEAIRYVAASDLPLWAAVVAPSLEHLRPGREASAGADALADDLEVAFEAGLPELRRLRDLRGGEASGEEGSAAGESAPTRNIEGPAPEAGAKGRADAPAREAKGPARGSGRPVGAPAGAGRGSGRGLPGGGGGGAGAPATSNQGSNPNEKKSPRDGDGPVSGGGQPSTHPGAGGLAKENPLPGAAPEGAGVAPATGRPEESGGSLGLPGGAPPAADTARPGASPPGTPKPGLRRNPREGAPKGAEAPAAPPPAANPVPKSTPAPTPPARSTSAPPDGSGSGFRDLGERGKQAESGSRHEAGDTKAEASKDGAGLGFLGGAPVDGEAESGLRGHEVARVALRATIYSLDGPSVVARADALFRRPGLEVTDLRQKEAAVAAYRVLLVRAGSSIVRDLVSDLESLSDTRVVVANSPTTEDANATPTSASPSAPTAATSSRRHSVFFILVDH